MLENNDFLKKFVTRKKEQKLPREIELGSKINKIHENLVIIHLFLKMKRIQKRVLVDNKHSKRQSPNEGLNKNNYHYYGIAFHLFICLFI